jgi:predicted MPP superfamily phosphohydrolase
MGTLKEYLDDTQNEIRDLAEKISKLLLPHETVVITGIHIRKTSDVWGLPSESYYLLDNERSHN